jgi:hypothetical protein
LKEELVEAETAKSWFPQFYALLIGPLSWAADLGLSYAAVYHACSTGHHYVLHIISVVTFFFCLTGAYVAWQEFQAVRDANDEGGSPFDRAHFLALLGIAASLGFAMVIIATAVPKFVFSPCQ